MTVPIPQRKPPVPEDFSPMAVPLPNLNLNQNAFSDAGTSGIGGVSASFGDILQGSNKIGVFGYAAILGGIFLWLKFRK